MSSIWWHGSRKPLDTIDFSKNRGFHLGPKSIAEQFGPNLYAFTLSSLKIKTTKDTGDEWKQRIINAKKQGFNAIRYLNRFEGINPRQFDAFEHQYLNTISDTKFLTHFPNAQYCLVILKKGLIHETHTIDS